MDRRAFLAGAAALLAAPRRAEAQQASKVARIGVVVTGGVDYTDPCVKACVSWVGSRGRTSSY